MKKICGILLLSMLANVAIADTSMPSSNTLLNNFDKLGIVAKSKWKNGEAPDGTKLLTYSNVGDIYSLNPESVSSISLTKGEHHKEEVLHSELICKNLVYGVLGEKNKEISDAVSNVVYGAARSRDKTNADSISDFWIEAEFSTIGNLPALICKVSKIVTWD